MIGTKEQVIEFLNNSNDDDLFEITKKRTSTIRTTAQNKYYFGVILEYICDFVGLMHKFEKLEQHKQIKEYFNLETTTELSPSEFASMCEEIRSWYLQNRGLYIPLPNEVEDLKSLEKYLF